MKKKIVIIKVILILLLEIMCFMPFMKVYFEWETANESIYRIAKSEMATALLQYVELSNGLEKAGMWVMFAMPIVMGIVVLAFVKKNIVGDCINLSLMLFVATYWLLGLRVIRQILDSILIVEHEYTIGYYVESAVIVISVFVYAISLFISLRTTHKAECETNITG